MQTWQLRQYRHRLACHMIFHPLQVLGLEAQPAAPHDRGSSHGLTRITRCGPADQQLNLLLLSAAATTSYGSWALGPQACRYCHFIAARLPGSASGPSSTSHASPLPPALTCVQQVLL